VNEKKRRQKAEELLCAVTLIVRRHVCIVFVVLFWLLKTRFEIDEKELTIESQCP